MNSELLSAAHYLELAVKSLMASLAQIPPIARMVIEPIISVVGPLATRVRHTAEVLDQSFDGL